MTRSVRRVAIPCAAGFVTLAALVGSLSALPAAAAGKPGKASRGTPTASVSTTAPSASTSSTTVSPSPTSTAATTSASSAPASSSPTSSAPASSSPASSSPASSSPASSSPTAASTATSGTATAPATQGSWVSPEGVTISVNSAGSWTIAQVYSMLTANALDLGKVGPALTINVQDQYSSQTQTSATYYAGRYTNIRTTMWLLGVNSNFVLQPDDVLAHEYGHAWSNYWYYVAHNGDWSTYLNARWTTSDGSTTLATDSRTGTTYSWTIREIVADDYRLLFGSSQAIAERPTHLNSQLVDPRNVPGLQDFLLTGWRTP